MPQSPPKEKKVDHTWHQIVMRSSPGIDEKEKLMRSGDPQLNKWEKITWEPKKEEPFSSYTVNPTEVQEEQPSKSPGSDTLQFLLFEAASRRLPWNNLDMDSIFENNMANFTGKRFKSIKGRQNTLLN